MNKLAFRSSTSYKINHVPALSETGYHRHKQNIARASHSCRFAIRSFKSTLNLHQGLPSPECFGIRAGRRRMEGAFEPTHSPAFVPEQSTGMRCCV